MSTQTFWRAMSHFGRFIVSGKDAAALLHHLTTNNIKRLRSGEGCDTVLINNKARVLDWLTIWRDGDEYRVLTSPNRRSMFVPHAQRFILFRQEVRFADVSEQSSLFGLFGDGVRDVLAAWNTPEVLDLPANSHVTKEVDGVLLSLSPTRRMPQSGVLIESKDRNGLEKLIRRTEIPLCDDETYNMLRIESGLPATGLELTEDVNPWEANLDFAISLDKGCYNGQEVIARLHTYKKIKQKLMGLKLQQALAMSELANGRVLLKSNGRDAGFVTSSANSQQFGPIALAYVRGDFQEENLALDVLASSPQTANVAVLPFS